MAWVCGRSLAWIASSNPDGSMDVSVMIVVVKKRSLRRADHSSRGVLTSVVCLTECGREASIMRTRWPAKGYCAIGKRKVLCCPYVLSWSGQGNLYPWTPHLDTRDLKNFVKLNIDQSILCLLFRASLIYINNCPTRCNTNQSIYYSASSLFMFRVSTAPIIRST